MVPNAIEITYHIYWASLVSAIEPEYGPSLLEQPRSKLFKLAQMGSIEEYFRQFMALANRTEGISDEARIDSFTNGLKPEVRREVVLRHSSSLQMAVELARVYN